MESSAAVDAELSCIHPQCRSFEHSSSSKDRNHQKRRSLSVVNDLIAKFDSRKRHLVELIGFGGLLKFPPIKYTNRRFAAWLIKRVDVAGRCIIIGDGSRLYFSSQDVSIVFGIPSIGRSVLEAGQVAKESREKISQYCWPNRGKEYRSIKALEETLSFSFVSPMDAEEEAAFKVAFVVYVMAVLLAPVSKYDYVSMDYWAAISDPDSIGKFNWAEYVLQRLLVAVAKYNSEINSGARSPNFCGCHLFLQVLYLDSIELGQLSFDHTEVPRITCFTAEAIRAMSSIDCMSPRSVNGFLEYGVCKLRRPQGVIYSWATPVFDDRFETNNSVNSLLWETALSAARVLRLPLESAGPLCTFIIEIQKEYQRVFGNIGTISIDVLLHIMRPYVHGLIHIAGNWGMSCEREMQVAEVFVDQCSPFCTLHMHCLSGVKRKPYRCMTRCPSCGSPASSVEACPVSIWVERIVHLAISKFHLAVAIMKGGRLSPIQDNEHELVDASSSTVATVGHHLSWPRLIKSPWEIGGGFKLPTIADVIMVNVEGDCSNQLVDYRPAVLHHTPKYIVVSSVAATSQFNGNEELEMDLFDALVRRFKQIDDLVYAGEGRRRWRHFFESDILASVIAGCFDINNSNFRNQFIGSHICYEVSNCVQLFFPVFLQDRWVCFCWCRLQNKIVIFDPIRMIIPGFYPVEAYGNILCGMKGMMNYISNVLFKNSDFDFGNPAVEVLNWPLGGNDCLERTGVACAYFCVSFDGVKLVPDISKDEFCRLSKIFQVEISSLEGNCGFVPWRPLMPA